MSASDPRGVEEAVAPLPTVRHGYRRALSQPRLAATVSAGIGLVVAALGMVTFVPHPTVAGALGLIIVAICLTALTVTAISRPFAPVALSFWAFVAVWVGFPPLLQIRDERLPWEDTPLTGLYSKAQAILLLAVIAFWLGYELPGRALANRTPHETAPRRPGRWLELTVRSAVTVTAATAALTLVALPFTGGLLVRFTSRDGLKAAMINSGVAGGADQALAGLVNTLPAGASLASLVICLLCIRNRAWADERSRRLLIGATAVATALNLIYNNPLTATRFASFSVALASFLCLVDLRRLSRRVGFAALMLGGLALVYPLANLFRNAAARGRLRLGWDAYYTFDFGGFQQTVNSVYYVNTHGHTWGHHLISALLFPVPRSIWEAKALPTGIEVAGARGYHFKNLALPLWAEMYVEYSWLGVALLMFCFGLVARRLDRIIQARAATAATVLAVLLAACQIGLLRGPIGAQLPFAAAAFFAAIGGMIAWRRRPDFARPAEGSPCTD